MLLDHMLRLRGLVGFLVRPMALAFAVLRGLVKDTGLWIVYEVLLGCNDCGLGHMETNFTLFR